MLQSIRDKTHGWIAGVIISLLILSFGLWGIHSYLLGAGDNDVIAKVNGTEITKNQLGIAYERLHRQMQMQFAPGQIPEQVESGLKTRALQTLIQFQLLEQAASTEDYRITLDQVDNFLQNMPEFQVNGKFSLVRFQQTLNAALFTVSDFIQLIKATLLIDQPRLGILFTSFATPGEINDTMTLISQERNIQYLLVPLRSLNQAPIKISDEEIQNYYTQHQNEFQTSEQVSVDYILLSVPVLASNIHPSEEQLQNFYRENGSKGQSYEAVKNKLKETFIHQKAEEEFADKKDKLANLTYEHPDSLQTAAQELNLPIRTTASFTRDKAGKDITASPKVREAAFGNDVLNLRNNSDVISIDPQSVIVLRIKSHVPATVLPLSVVRNQIEEKLKTVTIEKSAFDLANKIKDTLAGGKSSLSQISQEYHLQWNNPGFIGRHATKIDQAILENTFEMPAPAQSAQATYAVAKVPNGFVVIALAGVRPGNVDASQEQHQAFADQIQSSQGGLEYELYKSSLMRKSKIVIEK